MEGLYVISVPYVVVSCFLNNGRDKIEMIVWCKTIDHFVEDDEFMFIFPLFWSDYQPKSNSSLSMLHNFFINYFISETTLYIIYKHNTFYQTQVLSSHTVK